jgi:UPF0716 protein FxsA
MWLLALILGLPLIEIALFVTVGAWIGLWGTLAIVLGTAVLGVWLIRRQGGRAQRSLRMAMEARRNPTEVLARDVFVVVAGALLILPGFFTDTCGVLLLLPPVQRALARYGARRAQVNFATHGGADPWGGAGRHRPDQVIDTTWEEVTPRESGPPSGWTKH